MHPVALAALLLAVFVVILLVRKPKQATAAEEASTAFEREVSAKDFDRVLERSCDVPVMVQFHAAWCRPCQAFTPLLREMVDEYGGAFLLARVDYDTNQELAARYGVESLPSVVLIKEGKRVDGFSGGRLPHSVEYFLAKNGVPRVDSAGG
ncbi:MAG: hypothetical protein EA417_06240 [Gammaproteobacteria bacterium]|nr:MAG: hypothetical protein EA417_06240 [Gammaproteobacteria bacterium]